MYSVVLFLISLHVWDWIFNLDIEVDPMSSYLLSRYLMSINVRRAFDGCGEAWFQGLEYIYALDHYQLGTRARYLTPGI